MKMRICAVYVLLVCIGIMPILSCAQNDREQAIPTLLEELEAGVLAQSKVSEKPDQGGLASPGVSDKQTGGGSAPRITPEEPKLAGEIFGVPVPRDNFYFVLGVVLRFGSPWGGIPNNQKQLEERIWDDLILSYEAFRRDIQVSAEEIEREIDKTVEPHKLEFDWRKDREAYAEWAKKTLSEPVELFENQMRHLVQVAKLRTEIIQSITPEVTEEEALEEFINEYNTMSVELIKIDDLEEAKEFYGKSVEDPAFWDAEAAKDNEGLKKHEEETGEKKSGEFKRPGFVSTEFLMHMWKFPKDDVLKMMDMEEGAFYPPTPIYEGYGVFKILKIKKAVESDFEGRKESYFKQLRAQKKHEGFWQWLKQLRKDADMKKYIDPPEGIFNQPSE
ncbi:MAG: hypothetical protein ABIJ27_04855 [Candidatus Omnitrophota bacterium]